jgi:hypothetical protein
MLELFAELIGPETAIELAKYARAQEAGSSLTKLKRKHEASRSAADETSLAQEPDAQ